MVVTAVYTSCTSTCRRTVTTLLRTWDELRRSGEAPVFVLVSLDPETDTPERLRAWKRERGLPSSWRLVTGGAEQTRELVDFLGIHVIDMGEHLVHDAKVVFLDAAGRPVRWSPG